MRHGAPEGKGESCGSDEAASAQEAARITDAKTVRPYRASGLVQRMPHRRGAAASACRQLLGLFKAEILSNMLGEDVMDLIVPGNGLLHTVLWIYV